jgi:hypothetical protein
MITKIPQYIYIYMAKLIEFFSDMHKVSNSWHDMNDLGHWGHWVLWVLLLGTGKGCKAQILKALSMTKNN